MRNRDWAKWISPMNIQPIELCDNNVITRFDEGPMTWVGAKWLKLIDDNFLFHVLGGSVIGSPPSHRQSLLFDGRSCVLYLGIGNAYLNFV
jgi:hypothetical protein